MVQANRLSLASYFGLVKKLPRQVQLAEREQIIEVCDFINRLLIGDPAREKFQVYARAVLQPSFDQLGWEPKSDEDPRSAILRADLIQALGSLGDSEIVTGCRERFQKYVIDPASLAPDLRPSILWVAGHYADKATWESLHELGLRTTSIEEKQNYYDALAAARDPDLITKTLQISLTDELPTSRALFVVGKVARSSDQPEVAWDFAKANMKQLLEKADAAGAESYAPSLFSFFADKSRVQELKAYARSMLPDANQKELEKAADEIEFRAEFRKRLIAQISSGNLP
jgi:aminopeptidase N